MIPRTRPGLHGSPEDVSHPGTGHIQQHAAAHPDLEAQLVLFSSPNVQLVIIATQIPEEVRLDGKQAAHHYGTAIGHGLVHRILGQDRQLFVQKFPIKPTPRSFLISARIGKVTMQNYVHNGAGGDLGIDGNGF